MEQPPSDQQKRDEEQDDEIDFTSKQLRGLAKILRSQDIFIPDSLVEEKVVDQGPPESSAECPCWSREGYRLWPVNGGWLTVRGEHNGHLRALLRKQFGFEDDRPFYLRKWNATDEAGKVTETIDVVKPRWAE